ncbi:kinesin-like protein KIF23 isoform X2 [Aplysia californica]|uniref:Kinesin-like protein n=1 Tax=Aplysia californica TaxID=6500 RepID=A0ABM1VT15_APLCA|nr:kinesin-like protein KIF23 isoform X2 [Aplysia californica]
MKPQRGKTPRKRNANSPFQEPVEVYCRLRPLDDPNEPACAKPLSNSVVQLTPSDNAVVRNGQVKEYQYTFQNVFDEFSSQKAVFDRTALPLVEDLVAGKNGLLFTYGITGSGKTYTMTGVPQDQGILPRCLDVLFNSIGELQSKKYVFKPDRMNGFEVQTEADAMLERQKKDIMPNLTTPSKTPSKRPESGDIERIMDPTAVGSVEDDNCYAVFVSYIEIYNNYVYDLLDDLPYNPITGYKPPQTKILRTDSSDNMYVHNCTEVEVKQPQDAIDVFYKGQKRRKVAHTTLNAESSRSHSVFNIRLVQAPLDGKGEEVIQDSDEEAYDSDRICVSQLSLVDLAGSERTNRTKNSGDRLKEAGNINQSLMVLRTCLEILRENQTAGNSKLVPYRDSRLTHLFKTFFDGDGKVRMIVCVNPRFTEYEETIHVMKFAEMTQEVLITKSVSNNKFDMGLTPGRRRLHQHQIENGRLEEMAPHRPQIDFSIGPPFPLLELVTPTDDLTICNIGLCLDERLRRRQLMILDYEQSCAEFRAQLVDFEKDYNSLRNKCSELEERAAMREKEASRIESKNRSLERKLEEMSRVLKDLEKENQLLGLQVQDKAWKIQVEKNAKEKLRSDYKSRLQMNNQAWEKNMEKTRRQMEIEAENQLDERDRKLDMLRDIVNEQDAVVATPRTRSRAGQNPTPKPRTHTTPASIQSARSEIDMSSIGASTIASSARAAAAGRAGNTRVPPRSAVRIPAAKSIPNLSQVGLTPTTSKSRQPVVNPRYHRRSKSSGNAEVWLEHKPVDCVDTNTLMQPKMTKKKSVSKLDVKDTKSASKYVLTHQEQDSSDELVTKLVKGDVIKTPSGGSAVVFNDVETLRRLSPGTRKRRSPTTPMYDPEMEWTDTEDRCSTAVEGHKRSKTTNL